MSFINIHVLQYASIIVMFATLNCNIVCYELVFAERKHNLQPALSEASMGPKRMKLPSPTCTTYFSHSDLRASLHIVCPLYVSIYEVSIYI